MRAWLLVLAMAAPGCGREIDDRTADGALTLFLDALERSEHDRSALAEAYRLLDPESRHRLAERARGAVALGARPYEPWEMIADGQPVLRFAPRRGGGLRVRSGPSPDVCSVIVTGAHDGQRAEVPMRREGAAWRVVLQIPAPDG